MRKPVTPTGGSDLAADRRSRDTSGVIQASDDMTSGSDMARAVPRVHGDGPLLLLALAAAGGVVGYVPLLTLLLPAKVAAIAGNARIEWLGAITLAGAIAASLSNLLFGWASDLTGTRRAWAAGGLCLTLCSYLLVGAAGSAWTVVGAVVVYQIALNMLLASLQAWAADAVPDRRKGLFGGLLGAGQPIGALVGVLATAPALDAEWQRLAVVCAFLFALTAPLLFSGASPPAVPAADGDVRTPPRVAGADFALLWFARLLVQIAGSLLFVFLLFYFEADPHILSQPGVARLSAVALLLAFPIAMLLGRWSDRLGFRKPFLVAAAGASAAGLILMASRPELGWAAAGYGLFGCGSAVFLALHSTYAMQLLPSPERRGRDLGVLNLANTLPSVVAPLLAISLLPGRGFGPLLMLLAGLIALAGVCVLLVRQE